MLFYFIFKSTRAENMFDSLKFEPESISEYVTFQVINKEFNENDS